MARSNNLILGMLMGAGLMYLLDPERGRQRRTALRGRMATARQDLEELGGSVADHAQRLRARAERRPRREQVDDVTLTARVRAALATLVSNPVAVGVVADHGRITLTGTVVLHEVDPLVDGVEAVPGVVDVINRLRVSESPGDIPGPRVTGS